MIIAIDLAAKYSAVCVMETATGKVVDQFDSWNKDETTFITSLEQCVLKYWAPDVIVVEDVPFTMRVTKLIKHVFRLQGRIIERMNQLGLTERLLFVPPDKWQRTYDGVFKGGVKGASAAALTLGYVPPIDPTKYKGKERTTAHKVNSDYCDAFLIARWARSNYSENGIFDVNTTSRYGE